MSDRLAELNVPAALRSRAAVVLETTDRFCLEHLDTEYAELCRRLLGRLARERPSPIEQGDLKILAGAVLYTVGWLNFLFDLSQEPHLTGSDLCRLLDVSHPTVAKKSREIRKLLLLAPFDAELSRQQLVDSARSAGLVEEGGVMVPAALFGDPDQDDEELFESLEEADREALEILREALPELRGQPAPTGLHAAATALRGRLQSGDPVLLPVARANGWSGELPPDDQQLWIESAGALVAMKEETGLDPEDESLLMTLEHPEFLGAVVGAVRAGTGSPAGPADLTAYIESCPEVEVELDDDDRVLIEAAFELVTPAWQAAGALDDGLRLTELGRWGLPRALAWAWDGDFDADDPS